MTPLSEQSPLGPESTYGVSKRLAEDCALGYVDQLQLLILRPFNLIGPGMPDGLLIPDLLERIDHPEPVLRMAGSNSVRDFVDVRDAIDACIALLHIETPSGTAFNLSSGRGIAVSDLVATFLRQLDLEKEIVFAGGGSTPIVGLSDRLQKAAGWKPKHSLEGTVASILKSR